ncbi:MAG: MBL fold metallo-hydrolase [Deltaproteobacteria bacterium]|nr:MBL fold metallo-hydrolase [Deltaproteobacteria bacterium]
MILKQYYLGCLAHASYLVGDRETGVAAVIDPQRDVDQYIADAKANGLKIRHVFLTHFHADFLAGHLELRDREGAAIYLGARAGAEYAHTPLKNGDVLEFGKVRLEILETPGHTPEGISIVVYDLEKDARKPQAVFTGDTLFIGDVGRPDLLASIGVTADELARMLYHSLHERLMKLPDETIVYPAHGAGSLCGKNLSSDTSSTIGIQRKFNYALQPMSEEEFRKIVTADQPDAPAYFVHDAILNRKERQTLDEALEKGLKKLAIDDVLRLQNAGAQVVDVRDPAEFEAAHLKGSLNIGLGGKYATWAGTLLDKERPIVIIAEPGRENEAATRLGRIGFDNLAGYLHACMEACQARPELVEKTERITAGNLAEAMASKNPPLVVDIRSEKEWSGRRIGGSINLPLNRLRERADELSRDRSIVVHCASGYRSAIGASILQQMGYTKVADLVGGIAAWEASRGEPAAAASCSIAAGKPAA